MRVLTCRFEPARGADAGWPWPALAQIAMATAIVAAAGLALGARDGLVAALGRSTAGAALQALLLAAGWVIAGGVECGWPRPAVGLGAVMIAAALATRASAWGAFFYAAVPLLLVSAAHGRPEFRAIGLRWPGLAACVVGLVTGLFLGVHLLVTASLTFGHGVRVGSVGTYLGAVAYDVGANVLTAEWLFRGALFTRWWRQWAFWPAAGASTACALVRYLADPNVPRTVDVTLGAVFYLTLLGLSACALRARTGSLLPGYGASLGFFLGYRALGA